jgi:hypothetical protein
VVRFSVVIDGKLTAEQQQSINASIQQAVLPHLAKLGRNELDVAVLPHKEWLGLIALELSEQALRDGLARFGELEQQVGIR